MHNQKYLRNRFIRQKFCIMRLEGGSGSNVMEVFKKRKFHSLPYLYTTVISIALFHQFVAILSN